MKIRKVVCQIVVWSASLGITAPQLSYGAGRPRTIPTESAVASVRDVALSTRGNLQGKVVDSSGKPLAASQVQLKQQQVAGQAATDLTGKFTVAGVRPGLYEVATDNATGVYRVWSNQTLRRRRSMVYYSSTARMWYALRDKTGAKVVAGHRSDRHGRRAGRRHRLQRQG